MPSHPESLYDLLATLFQVHPWHGVPADAGADGVFNAYIELVPADTVKYELDKAAGHLRLDRPQRFSSQCPTPYGFIPRTLCGPQVGERCTQRTGEAGIAGDGDPMDICVLTERTILHGNFLLHARPIGGLRMIDGGQADDKIVAVLEQDLTYGGLRDIAECPRGIVDRLHHYFLTYKQQPDQTERKVRIAEVYDRAEALEMIRRSRADYLAHVGSPESRLEAVRRHLSAV
ncbi:MAG TPA: inorganic pyrophosphatase [bacterium]|nr:inorganic pyrophosphatase [bacterium]